MSNTQRTIVLIIGVLLAPILFVYGAQGRDNAFIMFGGPILTIGLGIYVWVGREKGKPPGGGQPG